MRRSEVPTLVIGGTLDLATPARNATRELMPHLPDGRQVVLSELGHTTDFLDAPARVPPPGWSAPTSTPAGSTTRATTAARWTSARTVTQTLLAKAVAGGMAGFALLTVLSLLALWRTARRRGRVPGRGAAAVRSAYAPQSSGSAGGRSARSSCWRPGSAPPSTPPPVVVPSVGLPVGLAVYWAWGGGGSRAFGLAAALGGAALGASLGFSVAPSPVSILTAIPGAVALANLGLIALDVRRERPAGASVFARKARRLTA